MGPEACIIWGGFLSKLGTKLGMKMRKEKLITKFLKFINTINITISKENIISILNCLIHLYKVFFIH